ncbi:MAG TPA: BON domain-containing protein [Gemmata sp.]
MKVRALFSFAVAAGLSGSALAEPPARLSVSAANPNQTLADDVAFRLRSGGNAAGADVSIVAQEGIVTLAGTTKDAAQKARLIADAKSVTGVTVVRDNIRVLAGGVVQVQDPPIGLAPIAPTPLGPTGTPLGAPPAPGPLTHNPIVEPAPLGLPGQAAPDMQAPNLPPYAWPTYAPYNNLSRVAYPQAYPYNAFPFIGPYYPFPKVPLGWRKVTLEWEDGHWYLGRQSAPHDYWRVKFQ